MKELTEAEKQVTTETRKLLVSLDEKQKNVFKIEKSASDLQIILGVKQIEKCVAINDMCLHSLVNSDSLNQTKLAYKIDTGLKTITASIQRFGEVVVESKPCETNFVRKKEKQAQMMVADI
jgi:hypothetical protein